MELEITKETILLYLKEYPEIDSRHKLHNKNRKLYDFAKNNNMLDELFGYKLRNEWTEDKIKDYVISHPEIKSRKDLKETNSSCFVAASRRKMLDELFGELPFKYSWKTKEDVINFMKLHPEIKTRMQLRDANQSAYCLARELGILDEICECVYDSWSVDNIRNYLDEHPEIKTRSQFKNKNIGAFMAAKRLEILDDLLDKVVYTRWTKDLLNEFLLKHPEIKTRKDFKDNYPDEFGALLRKKLIDDVFGKYVPQRKYSEDDVRKYVSEHPEIKTRTQLEYSNQGIYTAALRLKMLDELFGELPQKRYSIYVYEVELTHSAYVGLTSQPLIRDYWHRNPSSKGDTLLKHCKNNNIEIPNIKFLVDNLSPSEAAKEERRFWNIYKNAGWNMINGESNLGFLGNRFRKWNKENIIEFLENHPEIQTSTDFRNFRGPHDFAIYKLKMRNLLFDENNKRRPNLRDVLDDDKKL